MRMVINRQKGGFGFFDLMEWAYILLKPKKPYALLSELRTDPNLIKAIETLGEDNQYYIFKIVEIPDDATEWFINCHNGKETITYIKEEKVYEVG